jgi:DNA polymerase elongation subunit (family B)
LLISIINSGYGLFGDDKYEYYDPRVAELVTAVGRQALSKMQSIAKDLDFKITYKDTDSLIWDNPEQMRVYIMVDQRIYRIIFTSYSSNFAGLMPTLQKMVKSEKLL